MKWNYIDTNIEWVYKGPYELPNALTLMTLGNKKNSKKTPKMRDIKKQELWKFL